MLRIYVPSMDTLDGLREFGCVVRNADTEVKKLLSSSGWPITQEQPSRKGASFFRLRTINQ